jgi:hypothetical protein
MIITKRALDPSVFYAGRVLRIGYPELGHVVFKEVIVLYSEDEKFKYEFIRRNGTVEQGEATLQQIEVGHVFIQAPTWNTLVANGCEDEEEAEEDDSPPMKKPPRKIVKARKPSLANEPDLEE